MGVTLFALGFSPASGHSVAFNCPNTPTMCGYRTVEWQDGQLFSATSPIFGSKDHFDDNILSAVNNDTTGYRICLMETDVFDWPWIGVPAGVGWHNLGEQGVNNVADYVQYTAQADPCD